MTDEPAESEGADWLEGWAYRLRWLMLAGTGVAWLNFIVHVLSFRRMPEVFVSFFDWF